MKRRRFLLASGTAVLSSTAIPSSRQPVVGLDFNLSADVNADPSTVDSILVDFTHFELLPKYLDEDAGKATITITLDVDNKDPVQYSTDQQLTNGQKVTKSDIGNMIPLVVDGIGSTSVINGEVRITVEHPSVSDSYKQSFFVSDNGTPEPIDNPIIWYPMNEGSGDTLDNKSGSIGSATIAGQSGWTTGDFIGGSATKLESSSDTSNAIELPNENGQYPANDFTIGFTVKFFDSQNTTNLVDINASGSSIENRDAGIYVGGDVSNNRLRAGLEGDYYKYYNRSSGLTTDQKYRILVVRDGGSVEFFVNGSSIGSQFLYDGTISYSAGAYEDNSVHIGGNARDGSENATREAVYDDFVLYDTVMNDAQSDYARQPWS